MNATWKVPGRSANAHATTHASGPRAGRLDSLDAWRGLIIILMVLDHVRDFFHAGAFFYAATDPAQTNLPLFATRWITHLCAPTFVFLAGIAIRLQREKSANLPGLSRFLLARGLWLIVLEFTVISFGLNMGSPFFFVQILYAIGVSMALMAALVWLPSWTVLLLGALAISGAPLLIGPLMDATGFLAALRTMTVLPGGLPGAPGIVLYPFLPWLGVMCLGYGYGHVFKLPAAARNRTVAITAVLLLLAFAIVRGINGYGDLAPWHSWPDALRTAESFLNVTKYPATPDYVMVTLGTSMLVFLALDRLSGVLMRPMLTFGRTPLFTYTVHFYVAHGLQFLIGMSFGFPAATFTGYLASFALASSGGHSEALTSLGHWGLPLWGVYIIWISVLLLVYPLSRWFEGIKQRRNDWWLRYL